MTLPNGPVTAPVLDPIELSSAYDTVPIHGVSQPNTTVLVTGSDGSTHSVDVASSGRFCIDLPLQADQANDFTVIALNGNGRESDSVTFTVRQQGSPTQAPTQDQPQNASLGGNATYMQLGIWNRGGSVYAAAEVIDDDSTTWVEGLYISSWLPWGTNPDAAVITKLQGASRVNKIRAIAPSDCPFAGEMHMFYSSADAPSPPNVDRAKWVEVHPTVSGALDEAVATMPAAIVTHVAVTWPHKKSDGTTNDNCGNFANSYFGLAELQAWTVPNAAPPAPRAPSCDGGAI